MQTFTCTCGNRLFFENTRCVVCQKEVGWCEACSRITTLEPTTDAPDDVPPTDFVCGYADCRRPLRKCHNYAVENVCNRCYSTEQSEAAVLATPEAEIEATERLCQACELTETIPDLTVEGHREKWARLEAAKRRVLYMLDRLGLPYRHVTPPLSFDFKADVERPNDEWRNAG